MGDASLGLKLIGKKKKGGKDNNFLIDRHQDPTPRVKEAGILARSKLEITSMIDISDGLVQDLYHICKASNVGARIYQDRLPQSAEFARICGRNSIPPIALLLNGGEDYELLFTLPADGVKNLTRQFLKAKVLVTQVGEIALKPRKVIPVS